MIATTMDGRDVGSGIPIGTDVHSGDGVHRGVVVEGDAYELAIEQGWFLVRDHQVRFADVDRFEDSNLILWATKTEVGQQGDEAGDPPSTCAKCGGTISQDDVVCPHCGVSLVAG